MEHSLALQQVRKDWRSLEKLPQYHSDYFIVFAAVENYGRAIRWASEILKDNETLAKLALKSCPRAYLYLSHRLRSKEALCLMASRVFDSALFIKLHKWIYDVNFISEVLKITSVRYTLSAHWDKIWILHESLRVPMMFAGYNPPDVVKLSTDDCIKTLINTPYQLRALDRSIITREMVIATLNSAISQNNITLSRQLNRGLHSYIPENLLHDTEVLCKLVDADSSFLQQGENREVLTDISVYLNREFVNYAIHVRLIHLNNMYGHKLVGKKIVKNRLFIPITSNILTNRRFIAEMIHSVHGNILLLWSYIAFKVTANIPYAISADIIRILANKTQ